MSFCAFGENCSVFDRQQKIPGYSHRDPLCEGCLNRSRSELNLLRYDYVDLSQLIPKKDGHSEAKIARPKPESTPPVDVGVLTLRSDMAWHCTNAESHLRTHLSELGGFYRAATVREGYGLDAAVRYLSVRVQELAAMPAAAPALPSGLDYLTAFGDLHRRARKVCGLDPRTVSVPGDCPHCQVPSLRRHDDEPGRIWCQRCRAQYTKDGYYQAMRMQFAPSQRQP